MKRTIFDYIKENKVVSIHEISNDLNLSELFVLRTVTELRNKGFIRMCPPVPLSISNNTSCFYTTTSKVY